MTSKLTRQEMLVRAQENVKALRLASRQHAFESARNEILADLQIAEYALSCLEIEPVADVVEWHHPTEERTCDIRWRRHDVCPGPLYTSPPPAPVYEFIPKDLDKALGVLGMALPESREVTSSSPIKK